MVLPIADLHCDLLAYLAEKEGRTAFDPVVRCSVPQLRQGGVVLQLLPAFSDERKSLSRFSKAQVEWFFRLPELYPDHFEVIHSKSQLEKRSGAIGILLAFENASSFCAMDESLEEGFAYLEAIEERGAKIAYISLTWNEENRFGGGSESPAGLKGDGKQLLQFLDGRKIAVDLSHASDALAEGILNFISQKSLQIPLLASHSNFRDLCHATRNLPREIAQELFLRGGIIGLNGIKKFLGGKEDALLTHLSYAMEHFSSQQVGFGADFFAIEDFPSTEGYFPSFQDASCYPNMVALCKERLQLMESELAGLCYENVQRYLASSIF